jgi:hypothetical protein
VGCVCVERKKGAAEMYGNVSVCVEKGAFGNAIVQWGIRVKGLGCSELDTLFSMRGEKLTL